MELIIALVLFVGLILCWAFLPGTFSSAAALSGSQTVQESSATANVS